MDSWMDTDWLEERTRAFQALANPSRLAVMLVLVRQKGTEMSVGEIQKALPDISQSSLSQHLTRLREAKLTYVRQEAQRRFVRAANPEGLAQLISDII